MGRALWLLTLAGFAALPTITKRGGLDGAEYALFPVGEARKQKAAAQLNLQAKTTHLRIL